MKHFTKKTAIAGAGGSQPKQKILAGTLRAPQLGNFDIAASYSSIEIVDLLCDGPIHSIVNDEGANVTNNHLMQGIYLDNTPVEVSNSQGLINDFDVKYTLNRPGENQPYYLSEQLNSLSKDLTGDAGITVYRSSRLFNQGLSDTFFCAEYNRTGDAPIIQNYANYIESIDFPFIKRADNAVNQQNYLYYHPSGANDGTQYYYDDFNTSDSTPWSRIIWTPEHALAASEDKEINYGHYFVNRESSPGNTDPAFIDISNLTSELHYYNKSTESSLTSPKSLYSVFLSNLRAIQRNATVGNFNTSSYQPVQIKNLASSLIEELGSLRRNYFGDTLLGRKTPSDKMLMLISIGTVDFLTFKTLTNLSAVSPANITRDILKMYIPNFNWKDGDVKIYFMPKINENGDLTNEICGLISIYINLTASTRILQGRGYSTQWKFPSDLKSTFSRQDLTLGLYKTNETTNQGSTSTAAKFNYSNLLCEFKNGEELQNPFAFFNAVHVDYEYGQQLLGPFRTGGRGVRRLQEDPQLRTTWGPNKYEEIGGRPSLNNGKNVETSVDNDRLSKENYSEWNKDNDIQESAAPIMHTIENPNVTSVYFTLGISSLKDTASADITYNKETTTEDEPLEVSKEEEFLVGDTYPAILVINVEWGKVEGGVVTQSYSKNYRIVCQINSQVLIDFGQPTGTSASAKNQRFITSNVKEGGGDPSANLKPYLLPSINEDENSTRVKRYIKVTKVSTETNSVLISRECSLVKVTEIIEANLMYPFSAMAGIKMDSRVFSSVPERSYDCRLKKIQIPTNYFPLFSNGTDKRYILNSSSYKKDYKIYEHDWNGEFKEGWTDNPAWILYDMLTNTRYGLGSYLDESQINIWELYKIGRFCDAVNDEGYFIGVSDGIRGLEPRFSCNVLFKESIKIFDAINVIANLFRGAVFFANSEIHFIDDRPRAPIALFSNTHVKDGIFSYSNNRRDQQFNTIEVAYLDRFDNFNSKIEFVEDEADIRKRGVFKTTINTVGVTSRSMARRIGQHMIYQTIKENQGVEFKAGLETLLCRPGDLIIIEDEMKTQQTNFGRILKKDISSKSLYIENEFNSGAYNNKITVYSPTGYTTSEELNLIADSTRSRLTSFKLTSGGIVSGYLAATYSFSHYLLGFNAYSEGGIKSSEQEYFAYYTGKNSADQNVFCYYNTGFSGWIFSTGQSFSDNTGFDKLILNTGVYTIDDTHLVDLNNHTGFIYDTSVPNRRSTTVYSGIHTQITYPENNINKGGILEEEISTVNNPQVVTFEITGYNNSGLNNNNYGSVIYLNPIDTNINLLELVQDGSPYRIERKNSQSQIYKVLTIREDSQNEYTVVATKYNTGKFTEIEDFSSNLLPADTFNTASVVVNNAIVETLSAPVIIGLRFIPPSSAGKGFQFVLDWKQVQDTVNYELIFTYSLTNASKTYIVKPTEATYNPTNENPNDLFEGFGSWTAKIRSLGNNATLLNSNYSSISINVGYIPQGATQTPVATNVRIVE